MSVLQFPITLILVLTFLVQVYRSVEKYLDGLPSTSVSFVEELSVSVPAITVCIVKIYDGNVTNHSRSLVDEFEDSKKLDMTINRVRFTNNYFHDKARYCRVVI